MRRGRNVARVRSWGPHMTSPCSTHRSGLVWIVYHSGVLFLTMHYRSCKLEDYGTYCLNYVGTLLCAFREPKGAQTSKSFSTRSRALTSLSGDVLHTVANQRDWLLQCATNFSRSSFLHHPKSSLAVRGPFDLSVVMWIFLLSTCMLLLIRIFRRTSNTSSGCGHGLGMSYLLLRLGVCPYCAQMRMLVLAVAHGFPVLALLMRLPRISMASSCENCLLNITWSQQILSFPLVTRILATSVVTVGLIMYAFRNPCYKQWKGAMSYMRRANGCSSFQQLASVIICRFSVFSGTSYCLNFVIRPRDGIETLWRKVSCRASNESNSWQSVKKNWGKWMYLVMLTSLLMQLGSCQCSSVACGEVVLCCTAQTHRRPGRYTSSTRRHGAAASSPCLVATTRTAGIRALRFHVKRFRISHIRTMAGT